MRWQGRRPGYGVFSSQSSLSHEEWHRVEHNDPPLRRRVPCNCRTGHPILVRCRPGWADGPADRDTHTRADRIGRRLGRRLLRPGDAPRRRQWRFGDRDRHRGGRRTQRSCAIQEGTANVVCWGRDNVGQATPPNAVNGVSGTATNIAAGGIHSCAIQAGTANAVCWGFGRYGQATPPGAVNGVSGTATDIAAGGFHSCAIQAGTANVVCWGSDFWGPATPPDAVNGVSGTATDIAAGIDHNCATQAGTGNVVCWGRDNFGQVTPPDAVNGVSGTATEIAAGGFHSCAIQAGTGNTVCWGLDTWRQATPPDAVNGVSGIATAIAAGRSHSCAIQAGTGNVVCWGRYVDGETAPPDAVNGVSGTATAIAAGGFHSLAIFGPPADCLCEVQNINPNQVVLRNVGTGGRGSDSTRKMIMTYHAVDAPGATCDPGEFSAPTRINLKMEDDSGNILIDSAKTIVCEQGVTMQLERNVFFQGPLNCANGAVPPPKPGFSVGTITSTGWAPGTADYIEGINIKCFE